MAKLMIRGTELEYSVTAALVRDNADKIAPLVEALIKKKIQDRSRDVAANELPDYVAKMAASPWLLMVRSESGVTKTDQGIVGQVMNESVLAGGDLPDKANVTPALEACAAMRRDGKARAEILTAVKAVLYPNG